MKLFIICFMLLFVLSTPLFALINSANLAGLWLFDEGKGKFAKDSSGGDLEGELIGSVEWVDGVFGKAVEFDGTGGNVKIPDHVNPTEAITLTAWAKSPTPTWNQNGWLMEKRDAYILHNVTGTKNMSFCVVNGGMWNLPFAWDTGAVGPDDITEWHMYTTTFDSKTGEWKIYIDGEVESELDCNKASLAEDNGPVFIGVDTCEAGRFGAGTVDEVAVFSVALSQKDIKSIYELGFYDAVLAVDKVGKMPATWAEVKTQY